MFTSFAFQDCFKFLNNTQTQQAYVWRKTEQK